MRYADPALCPDCRSPIPPRARTCPTCGLLVRHPVAVELFGTLTQADRLLGRLRAESAPAAAAPAPAARSYPPPSASFPPPSSPTSSWAPSPSPAPAPPRPAGGLGTASVPKVLLGLGALCLLVAAVVFLAVSWSWLGVGGRTAVLATLTAAAGGAALWLHRSGLRVAGEALMSIALGVLALDVVGAEASGLLDLDGGWLAVLTGGVVAAAAVGASLPEPRPGDRLVAPQVVAPLALLVVWAGLSGATDHAFLVGHAVALVAGGAALAARRASWTVLAVGSVSAAALVWAITALGGVVVALEDPAPSRMWLDDGSGWSLLASGALLALPGAALRSQRLLVAGLSGTALLTTTAITLPTLDSGTATASTVAAIAAVLFWSLVARVLPASWRPVGVVPAAVGSLYLGLLLLVGASEAALRVLGTEVPYGAAADVTVADTAVSTQPLLVVPAVLAVLVLVVLVVGRRRILVESGGVVAGLGAVVTLASYDVPLAAVVLGLALVAAGSLVAALLHRSPAAGRTQAGLAVTATVATGLAVLAALPSAVLTALAACAAVVDALVGLGFAKSKGEARRLIAGGGARIDGEKVTDEAAVIAVAGEVRLSAGKKHHGIVRAG